VINRMIGSLQRLYCLSSNFQLRMMNVFGFSDGSRWVQIVRIKGDINFDFAQDELLRRMCTERRSRPWLRRMSLGFTRGVIACGICKVQNYMKPIRHYWSGWVSIIPSQRPRLNAHYYILVLADFFGLLPAIHPRIELLDFGGRNSLTTALCPPFSALNSGVSPSLSSESSSTSFRRSRS
jgi:hypothetical protein